MSEEHSSRWPADDWPAITMGVAVLTVAFGLTVALVTGRLQEPETGQTIAQRYLNIQAAPERVGHPR